MVFITTRMVELAPLLIVHPPPQAADQVPFIPKPALILARCVTEVAKRGDGKTLVLGDVKLLI